MPVVDYIVPEPVTPSVTSVSQIIDRARRQLLGSRRTELNFLSGDIASDATSITFIDGLGGIAKGTYVGIDDELVYVRTVQDQTATVVRGMLGTTPLTHAGDTQCEVSPRFFRGHLLDLALEEILSWSPTLYRVPDPVILDGTTERGYDLAIGSFYDVIEVRHAPLDTCSTTWPKVPRYDIDRRADTDLFPSGVALHMKDNFPASTNLKIVYTAPFQTSTFTETTDLISEVGLEDSWLDILSYGIQWRALSGGETRRTDLNAQGEPRVKEEVPAGHTSSTTSSLKKIRDQRLAEEQMRLVRRYGIFQG